MTFRNFTHCGYDGFDFLSPPTVQTAGFRCRFLLTHSLCICRLVNEHPREGNNQQCCLRSRHNKNKTEIQTWTTAISRRIFLEHLDWTTQLLSWSWSPSQP
ncbi:uncharacterized protein LOC119561844 [Drosophila subpulchrella]|uniref:uncharacterized protein LOC119561844 n=1 Tax=Drosophila subpulchrella TaxID=1486046 RepID=UPI0018A15419|nr:uncharacterized protein LOC119561844 [Drosophila subpulchrella]